MSRAATTARRRRVNGRVVLITGASSGIGRACAEHLAHAGHRVFGTSRRDDAPGPDGVGMVRMDVDDDASVAAAVAEVVRRAGRLDAVVNNAGFALAGAAEETSPEEVRAILETNLLGAWRVCRAVLPTLRAQRSGIIVNISSLGGIIGIPFQSAYSAAKFALEGFSEALSMEVKRFGVRVVLVEPGDMPTGLTERRRWAGGPGGPGGAYQPDQDRALRLMEAAERSGPDPVVVARVVRRALGARSPRLRYIVGPVSQRAGALLKRFLPGRWFEALVMREYRIRARERPAGGRNTRRRG